MVTRRGRSRNTTVSAAGRRRSKVEVKFPSITHVGCSINSRTCCRQSGTGVGRHPGRESPLQACLREVEEETGLIRTTGTLRCVDHRKPDDRVVGGLRFIFDLGALQPGEIQSLRLPAEETAESRLVTPDEACHLVDTAQARRLATVLKSITAVSYLENGISPEPLGT